MSETAFLERCQTYIDCHLKAPKGLADIGVKHLPSVTISRQTGAGGICVANQLAAWLNERAPASGCPWTVFHKNLVQRVLEEHNLPARIAQFMPEDKVSGIADAVEELLGLHPPAWSLLRQTTETILQLAELGHAILVGRGANVITRRLQNTFHVRLVGSLDRRVERIMELHRIPRPAALTFIKKSDAGRKRYVRRYLASNIEDPLLYHVTLNTDAFKDDEAAALLGRTILEKYYLGKSRVETARPMSRTAGTPAQ